MRIKKGRVEYGTQKVVKMGERMCKMSRSKHGGKDEEKGDVRMSRNRHGGKDEE